MKAKAKTATKSAARKPAKQTVAFNRGDAVLVCWGQHKRPGTVARVMDGYVLGWLERDDGTPAFDTAGFIAGRRVEAVTLAAMDAEQITPPLRQIVEQKLRACHIGGCKAEFLTLEALAEHREAEHED